MLYFISFMQVPYKKSCKKYIQFHLSPFKSNIKNTRHLSNIIRVLFQYCSILGTVSIKGFTKSWICILCIYQCVFIYDYIIYFSNYTYLAELIGSVFNLVYLKQISYIVTIMKSNKDIKEALIKKKENMETLITLTRRTLLLYSRNKCFIYSMYELKMQNKYIVYLF